MYIRTEKNEAIDFSNYKDVDVKPGEGTSWELVAKNTDEDQSSASLRLKKSAKQIKLKNHSLSQ